MFTIRQCETDKDYASVAELSAELAAWDIAETQKLGISADQMIQFYYPVSADEPEPAPKRMAMTLLASAGSVPAGCIAYREIGPKVCEMKRLYVRPAFRGTGLGKAMVSSLVERAAVAGYLRICLETTRFMKSAMQLYDEAGFVSCEAYRPIPAMFRGISVFMVKDLGG
jgi:GNAT superfamily N-acetyltransferase